MKIGVLTPAFREQNLLYGCIKQFEHKNFDHLVLLSKKGWEGDWTDKGDESLAVATRLGAKVHEGIWATQASQVNYGLEYFHGYDWVIYCDADERWTPSNLTKLLRHIEMAEKDGYQVIRSDMDTYWKSINFRISPTQTDFPVVAIRTSETFIRDRQSTGIAFHTTSVMHHLSYVRSDEDMLKKIQSFQHSVEFDVMEWYNNVWLKWTPESENLHPVVPNQFAKAVWTYAPEGIIP